MKYASTRGSAPAVCIGDALSAGLAPDGGLYVPQHLPRFDADDFAADDRLPAVAQRLLQPFFIGDALQSSLPAICNSALDIATPVVPLVGQGDWLLELFHGPTAAFKDYGARFLARCLAALRKPDDPVLTIVVATSGDTGAAVAAAFHRLPGFRVAILYPDGRVSPRQAHQLGGFGDNVEAFAVAGSFDDCQAMAKRALNDAALQRRVPMSSANSISLGRLLPQMSYYAHATLAHWHARGRAPGFLVPTGNLGNALACMLVRAMGLPVGDIVLATNANRALADYFCGDDYRPRPSIATLANAMDVGAPSNFERLRWLYPDESELRRALRVEVVNDDAIREVICHAHERHGIAPCPHTATALGALERLRARGDTRDWIAVATAHPAKFEQIVEPLIGAPVPIPTALAELLARPSRAVRLANDYAALQSALQET
jgi:threonine synthase